MCYDKKKIKFYDLLYFKCKLNTVSTKNYYCCCCLIDSGKPFPYPPQIP